MIFDPADESLFRAYGCLNGLDAGGRAYFETHYRRYRATIAFLGARERFRILELGTAAPFAFPLMVADRFPRAEIALAHDGSPVVRKYFDGLTTDGRVVISAEEPGHPRRSFAVHGFNAEKDVWPFDAESFDLVLCMEMLEHLLLDPCFLFREANRVLAPGGSFVVTTPNVASFEGVYLMLHNHAPYRFGPYSLYGEYGRHNREYVPRELPLLGEACGFATAQIATEDVYPVQADVGHVRQILNSTRDDASMRGQTIFYEGMKDGRPFGPYPESLYGFDVPEHSAIVRVRCRRDGGPASIRLSVEVANTGRYEWRPDGANPTMLGIQLLGLDRRLHIEDYHRVPLPRPLRPGEHAVVDFTVPDPKLGAGFCLKLDMVHEGVGWFYGAAPALRFEVPSNMDRSLVLEFD